MSGKLYGLATTILAAGLLIGLSITGQLNTISVLFISGIWFVLILIIAGVELKWFENKFGQLSGPNTSNLQKAAMDLDEVFEFVNEWLDDNKRDSEIEWQVGPTRSQQLTITSNEGDDYVFRALVAPYQGVSEYIFIIVECLTENVIDYDNVEKKSQVSEDMFDSSPEVKRMRKMNNRKGLSTDQLRNMVRGASLTPGHGIYNTGQPAPQNPQSESTDDDEDDDE